MQPQPDPDMIYVLNGKQYYHIKEFADITGMSIQAIRYLCFKGNSARKMRFVYEGSRVYIEAAELTGFPFVRGGHIPSLRGIYHYKYNESRGKWERCLCEPCTNGKSYDHDENMQHLSPLETV